MPKCNLEQIEALSDNNYWYYPIDQGIIGYNAVPAPANYDTHVCPYCGKISHCRNDIDVDDIIDIDEHGRPFPPRPPFPPMPPRHQCHCQPEPQEEEEEDDCANCPNRPYCQSRRRMPIGQYYRPYQYYGYTPYNPFQDYVQWVYPYYPNYNMPLYTEWLQIERDS